MNRIVCIIFLCLLSLISSLPVSGQPQPQTAQRSAISPENIAFNSILVAVGGFAEDTPVLARGRSTISMEGAPTSNYAFMDSALGTAGIRWDFLAERKNANGKLDYFTLGRSSEPASVVKLFTKVRRKDSSWTLKTPDAVLKESLTEYAAARPVVLFRSFKAPTLQPATESDQANFRVQEGTDIYLITYNPRYQPLRIQHLQETTGASGKSEMPIADIRYQNYGDVGRGQVPYQVEIRIASRPGFVQTICVDAYYVWPSNVVNQRDATVSKYAFDMNDKVFINRVAKGAANEFPTTFGRCDKNAR